MELNKGSKVMINTRSVTRRQLLGFITNIRGYSETARKIADRYYEINLVTMADLGKVCRECVRVLDAVFRKLQPMDLHRHYVYKVVVRNRREARIS